MIKLYALSTCPLCKKTKKLLDEKGAKYEAVDLDLLQGEAKKEELEQLDKLTSKRSLPLLKIVIQLSRVIRKRKFGRP